MSRLVRFAAAALVAGAGLAAASTSAHAVAPNYQKYCATHHPGSFVNRILTTGERDYELKADSREQMLTFCGNLYRNLAPGGRFITLTPNPDFSYHRPQPVPHSGHITCDDPTRDGSRCTLVFSLDPPLSIVYRHWSKAAYHGALADAGFTNIRWEPLQVSPEGMARFGQAFWGVFLDNPPVVAITCQK